MTAATIDADGGAAAEDARSWIDFPGEQAFARPAAASAPAQDRDRDRARRSADRPATTPTAVAAREPPSPRLTLGADRPLGASVRRGEGRRRSSGGSSVRSAGGGSVQSARSLPAGPAAVNGKPPAATDRDPTCSSTSSSSDSGPAPVLAIIGTAPKPTAVARGRSREPVAAARAGSAAAGRGSSRPRSGAKTTIGSGSTASGSKRSSKGASAPKRSASLSAAAPAAANRRGRSHSRSRPPPVRTGSAAAAASRRSRSRSQSLAHVTGPLPPLAAPSPRQRLASQRKPPSTLRTRQELLDQRRAGPGAASPRASSVRSGSQSAPAEEKDAGGVPAEGKDLNIGRDIITFELTSSGETETAKASKANGIMERLFGDQAPKGPRSGSARETIRPRILLAATVYYNAATNLWVTTINTNQRGVARDPAAANRHLKAFSFASEREAREAAIAHAPPKMVSFAAAPACASCRGRFAVFRRASHCRNCGVCVCPNCTTTWSAKCLPDTYNLKGESQVRVCLSCNSLCYAFKNALQNGDYEEAVALYGTGNVNLRTPFPVANKKEEVMYPIHCAVEGGNLHLIRWLVDDHRCPYRAIPSGRKGCGSEAPIVTSLGRSMMSIAVACVKVDIMRYLVAECGASVYECSDLRHSLRALETALLSVPTPLGSNRALLPKVVASPRWDDASYDDLSEPSSLGSAEPGPHIKDGYSIKSKPSMHSLGVGDGL